MEYKKEMINVKNFRGGEYAELKKDDYIESKKEWFATLIYRELCKIDFLKIKEYGENSPLPERKKCSKCETIIDENGNGENKDLCWSCFYPIYEETKKEEERQAREESKRKQEKITKVIPLSIENVDGDFIEIAFPNLNKNNEIELYLDQLEKRQYKLTKTIISEVVTLDQVGYDEFVQNLMANYDWLKGKGGCGTTYEKSYDECKTDEELKEFYKNAYTIAIKVQSKNRKTLYVDPQGYAYARYVGFMIEKEKSNVIYLKDYQRMK
jgi:hypothetical protein